MACEKCSVRIDATDSCCDVMFVQMVMTLMMETAATRVAEEKSYALEIFTTSTANGKSGIQNLVQNTL